LIFEKFRQQIKEKSPNTNISKFTFDGLQINENLNAEQIGMDHEDLIDAS